MENTIALTLIVDTDDHVGQYMLNPGSGTWAKGRDALPEWLKVCVQQVELA